MSDIESFLFTSESVNEGHPDKLADQVGLALAVAGGYCMELALELSCGSGTITCDCLCSCRSRMLFSMLAWSRIPMLRYVASQRVSDRLEDRLPSALRIWSYLCQSEILIFYYWNAVHGNPVKDQTLRCMAGRRSLGMYQRRFEMLSFERGFYCTGGLRDSHQDQYGYDLWRDHNQREGRLREGG
jgi:hypothetical protein